MPDIRLDTLAEAPEHVGKYRILTQLGRGGMGVVYEALDAVLDRRVALKVIAKELLDAEEAPALLARFKREAQAAGRLAHPSIVAVYDYDEDAERACIAMELVAGRGLDELLRGGQPLSAEEAAPLLAQLLQALGYAHAQGVVHRDIKPANLIVTEAGRVKVCDFGIAQLESARLTQAGTVLGTPSYMSPEQVRGDPTDARSDLFSAAVLAYQVLTGLRPFAGEQMASIMHAVLHRQPARPSDLNPALDTAVDTVLLKALAKDPAQRWPTAEQFEQALLAALRGEAAPAASEAPTLTRLAPRALPRTTAAAPATPTPTLRRIDFSAVRPRGEATPAPELNRPRVLFVDDEERILSALKLLFRQQYEVHTASGGEEALALLARHRFHLVVSDQRMPQMNGTELLARARAASPNTVRILLTGYSDLAAIVGSVNEGEVYRFASKPWNAPELRELVAEAAAIGVALEHAPPPVAPAEQPREAVLVLDADRELYLAVRDVLGRAFRVLHAADLQGALQVLRDEPVAVLLADIGDAAASHRTFFRLLKQEHPQIVTVAMTAASDSELVIELINQARIFRFLNKPLKLATLQSHVEAAMVRFQKQQARPELLREQRAQARATPPAEEGSLAGFILGSLRALRRRLAG